MLIERLRVLGWAVPELATAQVGTMRIKLLQLAVVVTRNSRRIRLYLASNSLSAPASGAEANFGRTCFAYGGAVGSRECPN